ncbi:MAG: hypothetical protein J6U31_00265 [Bacteroidales bacterium]|nr:hypothetical protein [Bacteroidales bacterium]
MEEIKIYHSVWRMLLMSIGCLAFAVNGCMLLQSPRTNHVIVWIGIIFFGLGGIVLLYWLIKERLTGQPFLTITDDCIICNGGWKKYVIRFADVESFVLLSGRQNNIIGIHYKKGVERQKMEEASFIGRLARKFNLEVSGTQESISVSGVSIKAQDLCNILNKRLQK